MRFIKQKFCFAVGCVVTCSLLVNTAFAGDINVAGSETSVPIPLTAEAALFSVTIPTQLPISVNSAGVVTTSTTAKIVNNSAGAVKVTNLTVQGLNGWSTVDYDSTDMSDKKVNSKEIALEVNSDKTTGSNTISFTSSNFPNLDGSNVTSSDELAITYNAKLPAQSSALSNAQVANVLFTVGWYE